MKPLRKAIPVVLMVWPYLLIAVMATFGNGSSVWNNDASLILLYTYGLLTVVVYGLNIWNACTLRDEKQLAFYSMVIKLVHVPFYLMVFCVGLVFALAMVVPALLFVSPLIISMLAIGDYLLLLTGSVYGISAAVRATSRGTLPKAEAILYSVLHCIFVLDVVGAVLVFCKLRKADTSFSG